jgi:hypothetical protein
MKSRWTNYKGARVMYCDFANFKSDVNALSVEVEAADREIMKEPPSSVLLLVDLRNTVASGAAVEIFKESSKLTSSHVKKQAVIGVSGFKRFLADVVARFSGQGMRLFDSETEAMDWLVGAHDGGHVVGEA